MCTIDPLMCWYYDNEKYWHTHPGKLAEAEAAIDVKNFDRLHELLAEIHS